MLELRFVWQHRFDFEAVALSYNDAINEKSRPANDQPAQPQSQAHTWQSQGTPEN